MMKALTLPNYPIMYKMNFIKGRLMKFQFDDFLFLYVYSGREPCVWLERIIR